MIIKERDSRQADIGELTSLLSLPLPGHTRFLVERELRLIDPDGRGEEDSASVIDLHCGCSEHWAVIHDLRLELLEQAAHIDHLLINTSLDMYVLDGRNYSHGLKITETGEFLAVRDDAYIPIESPIEQNKRHISLLEKVLGARDMMPARLGMSVTPVLKGYILISPGARLMRPPAETFDTRMVITADALHTVLEDREDRLSVPTAMAPFSRMAGQVTMVDVARKVASLHAPAKTDYRMLFGIEGG